MIIQYSNKFIYLIDPMTTFNLAVQVSSSTPDIPLSPPSQPDIQPGTITPEPEISQPSPEPEVPQPPDDPIIIEPTVPEVSPIDS